MRADLTIDEALALGELLNDAHKRRRRLFLDVWRAVVRTFNYRAKLDILAEVPEDLVEAAWGSEKRILEDRLASWSEHHGRLAVEARALQDFIDRLELELAASRYADRVEVNR